MGLGNLKLNVTDDFVSNKQDRYHHWANDSTVISNSSGTDIYNYTIINSGYYAIYSGISVRKPSGSSDTRIHLGIDIGGSNVVKDRNLIEGTSTGSNYCNIFSHWCGYIEAGDIVRISAGGQTSTAVMWEKSLTISPWGNGNTERPVSLSSDDNFIASPSSEYYFERFRPSNTLTPNSWIRVKTHTIQKTGRYAVFGRTEAAASSPSVRFLYCQMSKNGSASSSPPNAISRSLASARGSGSNFFGSSCIGVEDFAEGDSVDLWLNMSVYTGSTFPDIRDCTLSITPVGFDGDQVLNLDGNDNIIKSKSKDWFSAEYGSVSLPSSAWTQVYSYTVKTAGKYLVFSTNTIRGINTPSTRYIYNQIRQNGAAKVSSLGQICKVPSGTIYGGSTSQYAGEFAEGDEITIWVLPSVTSGNTFSLWLNQFYIEPWE